MCDGRPSIKATCDGLTPAKVVYALAEPPIDLAADWVVICAGGYQFERATSILQQ